MAWNWLSRILGATGSRSSRPVEAVPSRLLGKRYDFWSGHLDWLEPATSELDAEINALCGEFEAGSTDARAALTQSLNAADSYAFQHFAERSAVLGLRTGNVELVRRGIISVSAVSPNTIDFRDAGYPLARLYYCLTKCGVDASLAFIQAQQLASDEMADVFEANRKRYAAYSSMDDLCKGELVCEVRTQHGPGFVRPSIESFKPSCNLTGLSLRVVELLRAESRYQFNTVETASSLPAYWIWGRGNDEGERMKRDISAVCTVQFRLRPEYDKNPTRSHVFAQWLNIYMVETNDAVVSRSLVQAANSLKHERAAMLAVATGPLAAVAFALTASETARLTESAATLERFRESLSNVLSDAGHGSPTP
ncbi:MAG TPA: hypothetical protein VIV60_09470 [Polyangiaceae bacterium]